MKHPATRRVRMMPPPTPAARSRAVSPSRLQASLAQRRRAPTRHTRSLFSFHLPGVPPSRPRARACPRLLRSPTPEVGGRDGGRRACGRYHMRAMVSGRPPGARAAAAAPRPRPAWRVPRPPAFAVWASPRGRGRLVVVASGASKKLRVSVGARAAASRRAAAFGNRNTDNKAATAAAASRMHARAAAAERSRRRRQRHSDAHRSSESTAAPRRRDGALWRPRWRRRPPRLVPRRASDAAAARPPASAARRSSSSLPRWRPGPRWAAWGMCSRRCPRRWPRGACWSACRRLGEPRSALLAARLCPPLARRLTAAASPSPSSSSSFSAAAAAAPRVHAARCARAGGTR